MTLRAVIIGLLGAVLIATAGYFNDQVVGLIRFVGNQFPIIVFGPLVLASIVGALLTWLPGRRWRLSAAELAVIVTTMLAACSVPGRGLLAVFSRSVTAPIQINEKTFAWRNAEVLSYVPAVMLPNGGQYDREFMEGFMYGLGGDKPISLAQVPWHKWAGPLSFWVPLAFLLGFASICLALMVHRQWSQREKLRYPIAEFANTLLAWKGRPGMGPIFRTRLFWFGVGLIFVLHLVNGLAVWWPEKMIRIPRVFSFMPLLEEFPWWVTHWQSWRLFHPQIWPIAIAFGFLIASDVSLSLGLSQVAFIAATSWLVHRGVPLHGIADLGAPVNWQRAASCLAVAVMIVYTGRRYYGGLFRAAFTFRGGGQEESYAVWPCRLFIASMVAMVALLHSVGLDLMLASLVVLLAMTAYLIQARINTESGLILSQIGWIPSGVLLGLFGAKALGPRALVIIGLVGTVFLRQLQECLMPFVLNALRISQRQQVPAGRAGWLVVVGFTVALAAGVPFALWVDHNYGAGDHSAPVGAPAAVFKGVTKMTSEMGRPELVRLDSATVWQRLAKMKPDINFLLFAGFGFAVVLAISAMRLRFTWWPIHPIMFLVWGTWSMAVLSPSFLLGWIIKQITTRVGGTSAYRKASVFMYGVIAGELLGGILWMIVGLAYYVPGRSPPYYKIFP